MQQQQLQRPSARRGGRGGAHHLAPRAPALSPPTRRVTAAASAAASGAAASSAAPSVSSSTFPLHRQNRRRPVATANAAAPDAAETTTPKLSGANAGVEVAVPRSQEEALRDAVAALRAIAPSIAAASGGSLAASGKRVARAKKGGGAKGFAGGGSEGASSSSPASTSHRYAIELPVADTSPAASVALADAVLARLAPAGGAVIVFADESAAALAATNNATPNPLRRGALSLRAACRASSLPSATLLIVVAPAVADVALVEQLLEEVWAPGSGAASSSSSSPPALVLNPGWAERGGTAVPREYERLADSFEVAYSFCPVAISGLVRGKQGAVLLNRGGGDKKASGAWRILCESSTEGRFVQIGQARARPSDDDIQAAFLNASAAASPLTKAVKAAKGLF